MNGTDNAILQTLSYAGTRLIDITAMSYSTYETLAPLTMWLQFDVDYDACDATDDPHADALRIRTELPMVSPSCPVAGPVADITWDFETVVPVELSRFTIE